MLYVLITLAILLALGVFILLWMNLKRGPESTLSKDIDFICTGIEQISSNQVELAETISKLIPANVIDNEHKEKPKGRKWTDEQRKEFGQRMKKFNQKNKEITANEKGTGTAILSGESNRKGSS